MQTPKQSAEIFLQQGNELKQEANINEAIRCYHQAIQHFPDFASAYFQLAEIYESQQEFSQSITAYQKVIELEPENSFAQGKLARLIVRQGDLDRGITIYQQAIAQKITKPQWLNIFLYQGLANALEKKQQIDMAIAAYQKVLDYNPNKINIQIKLGELLFSQGNFAEAINYYRQVIEQQPNDIATYLKLAKLYEEKHEFDLALSCYQRVLYLQPHHQFAPEKMARLMTRCGDHSSAIITYIKAINAKPESNWLNFALYKGLGLALERNGQIEDAITAYKQAIKFDSNHGWTYAKVGNLMLDQNNATEAISYLQQAIAIEPDSHLYHYQLGQAFAQAKNYQQAINYYQQAIKLNPKYIWSYQQLSAILEQQEKLEQAQEYYQVAVQYYPALVRLKQLKQKETDRQIKTTIDCHLQLPKLAFCFLTIESLNQEHIWQNFFQGHEDLVNIYAHSKYGENSGFLQDKQIENKVETTYLRYKMSAEIALLKTALKDPENYKFLIISESCIPLQLFSDIYDRVISDDKSYVKNSLTKADYWKMPGRKITQIAAEKCRKNSQWIILNREHAQMMVDDNQIYPQLKEVIFLEEQYPGTFLHLNDQAKLINNQIVTFADFKRGIHGHPYKFKEITNFDRHLLLYAKEQGVFFARKFSPQADLSQLYQGTNLEYLL